MPNRNRSAAERNNILIEAVSLTRYFDVSAPWLARVLSGQPRQILKAVEGVNFTINRGESFSLVGESGCGKSTVAKMLVGLYTPTGGSVLFEGAEIASPKSRPIMKVYRQRMQMII